MTAGQDAALRGSEVPPLEPIVSYFEWWDCPRSGVTQLDGQPSYFLSEFSEDIDDYETAYRLWPVPTDAVSPELESWAVWCEWRRAFDSGEAPEAIERNR